MNVHPQILTFINKFDLFEIFRWPSFVPQMKKAFKRYLFPLCILLLGGFINLYADSDHNCDSEHVCYIESYDAVDPGSHLASTQSGLDKKHYAETEVEEQEEREEEAALHHDYLHNGGFLTAFFYASESRQHFLEPISQYGGFDSETKGSPLKRHIRFQVFRI